MSNQGYYGGGGGGSHQQSAFGYSNSGQQSYNPNQGAPPPQSYSESDQQGQV
jgi:hypothetical protein